VIRVLDGEKVAKSMELPRDAHCDLLGLHVISDSISLQDEIARTFKNFIFRCLHCYSTFICSVVRSTCTNMNSPEGKNVRLSALKYGIGGGAVGRWKFSLVDIFHGGVLRGRRLRARPLLCVKA